MTPYNVNLSQKIPEALYIASGKNCGFLVFIADMVTAEGASKKLQKHFKAMGGGPMSGISE